MLKAIVPRLPVLVVAFFLFPALAFAASDDRHLSDSDDRVFFLRSAFAHGYMHGYEEGFHEGDLDLQMERPFRVIKSQDKFKRTCGYRIGFGDHGNFKEGYRKGYAVGYTDSCSGRNFRATELVNLAKSQTLAASDVATGRAYDHAIKTGYAAGQQTGSSDRPSAAPLENADSVACNGFTAKDECAAYRTGYRLGYSDGYTMNHQSGAVLALK